MMFYNEFLSLANEVDIGRTRRRNLSSRMHNFGFNLTDREFVKTYRLSKTAVQELINDISPNMPNRRRSDAVDTPTKILVALAFYACGSYQTLVGQSSAHCLSQPSVSRAIQQVTEVLNLPHIFNKYVKFPGTREDRDEIKQGFYQKFGMSGVLGCIDGTHVAIVTPADHEERYFNRKGYHSLNVLVICDSDCRILCVDSSNPGSTHDSSAWSNNPLMNSINNIVRTTNEDFYLLGDSGFPLRRTMMTPILHAQEHSPEALYTEMHMTTRNVVERCIGILKARFRCLLVDRKLHYKPHVAAKIVNACCVLHNIALQCNIENEYDQDLTETERDAHIDAPQIPARVDHANQQLQEGRSYQQIIVRRLWRARNL